VPFRSKTGEAVASAFRSILAGSGSRRPMAVRTDRVRELVNARFRKLLNGEGIEMRMCSYPDVKCAIVERISRIQKSKLYKWFTRKNTYRNADALDKFVSD
jgi:hypothetical protein